MCVCLPAYLHRCLCAVCEGHYDRSVDRAGMLCSALLSRASARVCAHASCVVPRLWHACQSVYSCGKMSAAAGGRENEREDDDDVVPGPGPSKKKRLVS